MNRRQFNRGLCACMAGGLAGCVTQPVTTEGVPKLEVGVGNQPDLPIGYRPAVNTDEGGLWMQVEKEEANLKHSAGRITDPELNRYVSDMVCKIGGNYCRDVRVYILRIPLFNATMYPNGMMNVWSGLLLRCRNESQLAAVLGHEIAHYVRTHSIQRWRDTKTKLDFLAFLRLGLAAAGGGAGAAVGDLTTLMAIAGMSAFSRDHEREADYVGLRLMADAGYDPNEAAEIWRQLIAEEKAGTGEERSSDPFLASHPPPPERIDTLAAEAKRRGAPRTAQNGTADGLIQRIQPLRAQFLADDLRLRFFKKSEWLIDQHLGDGVRPGELYFFKGELYRQRNKEGDSDKAVEAYNAALGRDGAPPEAYRQLGLMHRARGAPQKAREAFEKYLIELPNAKDADIIRSYIEQKV